MKPVSLKKIENRTLGIVWDDGHASIYDTTYLREQCKCAACIDEWTGERKLKPWMLPSTVIPVKIDSVGHYALSIQFSDGHASGLYTYEHLRNVCQCADCQKKKKA